MEKAKTIFIVLGSAAGVYSFLRLVFQDILSFTGSARLEIYFDSKSGVGLWAVGPPYLASHTNRVVAGVEVANRGRKPATDCEAFIEILDDKKNIKRSLPLHWADTPYSALSSSVETIRIGRLPRRLDIAFTQEAQDVAGCAIASGQALLTGPQNDQFLLQPGEHLVTICINYNSGKSKKRELRIVAHDEWRTLEIKTT